MAIYIVPPAPGGAANPAGNPGDVQLNIAGAFGVITGFRWDSVSSELEIPGSLFLDDGGTYTTTQQLIPPTANRVQSYPDASGIFALVAGTSGQVPYNDNGVQAASNLSIKKAQGTFGYGSGGSAVTQATSKATPVTLEGPTGVITMNTAALAADASVSFTLTNASVSATDGAIFNVVGGGTIAGYNIDWVPAAGSAVIHVRNVTTASLSEAIQLRFIIVNAPT